MVTTSHTHNTTVLWLCENCPGQPGWAGTRRNIHPLHSSWSSIIPICFLHLLRHMASSLFNPRALQSFSTISLQVFFGLPLGLVTSTLYSIHFFTQSLSSFRSTCPYHHNLFCCSTETMSSNSSLPLNSLLETLSCNFTPHIHLTILISALWSATWSFNKKHAVIARAKTKSITNRQYKHGAVQSNFPRCSVDVLSLLAVPE